MAPLRKILKIGAPHLKLPGQLQVGLEASFKFSSDHNYFLSALFVTTRYSKEGLGFGTLGCRGLRSRVPLRDFLKNVGL